MRNLNIVLALFLGLVATSVAAQNKTLIDRAEVRPRTGEFAGRTLYSNSHAIIVGIGRYANLPREKWLNFSAADAMSLREVLIRSYGFPAANVTTLIDEQATKSAIEAALASIADGDRVKSDDRTLVFFSGHGQTVKLANGGEMGFLIPYDAKVDLQNPDNKGPYLATCIPMDHLWSYLEASPAKHSLLIADACFGGLLVRSRALTAERPSATTIATLSARPAQQVLTAGGKNEEAQEDPKLGHGYLTYKLLEELKAQAANTDAVFLASQLASSLKTAVSNLSGAKQTPQFGSHGDTEGDFVFVTTEPRPVPSLLPVSPPANPIGSPPPTRPAAEIKINERDGAEMVWIPACTYQMGDFDSYEERNPVHEVRLAGYFLYRSPVTVAQYKKFCAATSTKMPAPPAWGWKDDHPVVNVSWNDALAYCRWAGVRLPTEAEWEHAARGPRNYKYPWGNDFDGAKGANSVKPYEATGTTPVGSYPANDFGLFDMGGNVWNWCIDSYNPRFWQAGSSSFNPINIAPSRYRVFRGGSWSNTNTANFRTSIRNWGAPDGRGSDGGFRCAFQP